MAIVIIYEMLEIFRSDLMTLKAMKTIVDVKKLP